MIRRARAQIKKGKKNGGWKAMYGHHALLLCVTPVRVSKPNRIDRIVFNA